METNTVKKGAIKQSLQSFALKKMLGYIDSPPPGEIFRYYRERYENSTKAKY